MSCLLAFSRDGLSIAQYDNEKVTHTCGSLLRAAFGAPTVWVTTVGHFVGHTLVCYVGHFVVVFLFLEGLSRDAQAPSLFGLLVLKKRLAQWRGLPLRSKWVWQHQESFKQVTKI